MVFNKTKIVEMLTFVGKVVSFLSLVMTVVIKTRVLLGLKNPSEEWRAKNKKSDKDTTDTTDITDTTDTTDTDDSMEATDTDDSKS